MQDLEDENFGSSMQDELYSEFMLLQIPIYMALLQCTIQPM